MKLRWSAAPALLLLAAGAAMAQTSANPPIYSPVILGSTYDASTNDVLVPAEYRPDGTGLQRLVVSGIDFSRSRFGSGRYFLRDVGAGPNLGDDLVATDESGT